MKLRFLTVAVAAIGATLMSALPALAFPAQATNALNVRSGPSTGYSVVDVLYQGETVNVSSCNAGWCAITHQGPDGYVSGRYLTNTSGGPTPPPPPSPSPQPSDPRVGFCIDAPNFRFGVNCDFDDGSSTPPPGFPAPPSTGQVCFYEHVNYNGRSICANPGQQANSLNAFNDRISSIRVSRGASAYVCEHDNFGGRCTTISSSRANLGSRNNDIISSFRVR